MLNGLPIYASAPDSIPSTFSRCCSLQRGARAGCASWRFCFDLSGKVHAVGAGHHYIGYYQVGRGFLDDVQTLFRILGGDYVIVGKRVGKKRRNLGVVIDQRIVSFPSASGFFVAIISDVVSVVGCHGRDILLLRILLRVVAAVCLQIWESHHKLGEVLPTSLSISIEPRSMSTMLWHIAMPRPLR